MAETQNVSIAGYSFDLTVDDDGQLSIARSGRMIAAIGLDVDIVTPDPAPPPRFGESSFETPFVPEPEEGVDA